MEQHGQGYDYVLKFIVIGDMGVGKSCIIARLSKNIFAEDQQHTIGVEFANKIIKVHEQDVKLQIWDTAGQERFRSVTKSYYRGSVGVIIVYDISSRNTFSHCQKWLEDARNLTSPNTVIILVGNKADMNDKRDVTYEEAKAFSDENGLLFLETSAKTGHNVEEVFAATAFKIVECIKDGSIRQNTNPRDDNRPKSDLSSVSAQGAISAKSGCC